MKNQEHWSEQKEVVHSSRPILFTIKLVKILPHRLLYCVVWLVSLFYFLFFPKVRKYCRIYQKQLKKYAGGENSFRISSFRQILSFSLCFVEKIEGWVKGFSSEKVIFQDDDFKSFSEAVSRGQGMYLICSHLGNIEVIRSIAATCEEMHGREVNVVPIMDVDVSGQFNAAMQSSNEEMYKNMINSSSIGMDTIEILQDNLEKGSLIFCAGDRTPAKSARVQTIDFLGKKAAFPYGTFFIPALIGAPVYFMFCMREKDFSLDGKARIFVYKSKVNLDVPKKQRNEAIKAMTEEYAGCLEKLCMKYPYQWYNFFDFWNPGSYENEDKK